MTLQLWLMYLMLVIIAAATPGPAILFVVTSSTLHGWRKAVFAASGNIAGLLCLGILAVTGLGTILKTSELIYSVVKYAGAAYLVWLGIKLILQKNPVIAARNSKRVAGDVSAAKLFFQAFGIAMSNPKAIVFLTALLPQFINIHQPLVSQFSILIGTLMLMSFSFLMLYALLAHNATIWLSRPGRMKVFNRASGSLFIGFGALLAASSNT